MPLVVVPMNNAAKPPGGGKKGANEEAPNPLAEYEQQIMNDMLDKSPGVTWDDISGLAYAKQT